MRSLRRCSLHFTSFDVLIASALCVPGFVDGFGDGDDTVEGFVEVERDGHSSSDRRDIVLSSLTLEMRDWASMMKKKMVWLIVREKKNQHDSSWKVSTTSHALKDL